MSARVFVLAALLSALYWSIVRDMVVNWWDDPNYSHGFLAPAFSGYLIWLKLGSDAPFDHSRTGSASSSY